MTEASEQPKTPMEIAFELALKEKVAREEAAREDVAPIAGGSDEKLPEPVGGVDPISERSAEGANEKDFTPEQLKIMRRRAGLTSHFKAAGGLKEKGYKSEGFKKPGQDWWRLTHSEVIDKAKREMEADFVGRTTAAEAAGTEEEKIPPPEPPEPPPAPETPPTSVEAPAVEGIRVKLDSGEELVVTEELRVDLESLRRDLLARQVLNLKSGRSDAGLDAELRQVEKILDDVAKGAAAVVGKPAGIKKPAETQRLVEKGTRVGEEKSKGPEKERKDGSPAPPPAPPPEPELPESGKYSRTGGLREFIKQSSEELKKAREILVEAEKNKKQDPENYERARQIYEASRARYVGEGVLRMLRERERLAALEVEANPVKVGRVEKMWRAWGEVMLVPQSWREKFEHTAFGKTRAGQIFIRSFNMRTALSLSLWGAAAASGFGTDVGMIALGARSGLGAAGTYFGSQAFMEGLAQKSRFSVGKDKLEELSRFDFGGAGEKWDRERGENMGFLETEMARLEAASMLAGRNVEEVPEYRHLKNTYLKYAKTFREKTPEGLRSHLDVGVVMIDLEEETERREHNYKLAERSRRVLAGALAALFPAVRVQAYLHGFDAVSIRPEVPKVPVITPEWPEGIPELPKIIKPEPTGAPLPTPTPPEAARAVPPPIITPKAVPTPKGWPTPEIAPSPAAPVAAPVPEAATAPRVEAPRVLPTPELLPPKNFTAVETQIRGILDPEFAPRREDLERLNESLGYVSKVKKGGSIWQAGLELVDSGKMKKSEFLKAWKDSVVKIHGKEVPLSKVGLVHERDIVVFISGEKPRFEFIPESKMPAGADEDLFKVYKKLGKEAPEWLKRSVGADELVGKTAGGSTSAGAGAPSAGGGAVADGPVIFDTETASTPLTGGQTAEAPRGGKAEVAPGSEIVEASAVEAASAAPAKAVAEAEAGGGAAAKPEAVGLTADPEVARVIDRFRSLPPVSQEGMIERLGRNPANREVVELLLKDANYQGALERFDNMRESLINAEEYEKIKDMPVQKFLASVAEAGTPAEEADRIAVVGKGKWKIAKAARVLEPDAVTEKIISVEKFLKIVFWEFPEYLRD